MRIKIFIALLLFFVFLIPSNLTSQNKKNNKSEFSKNSGVSVSPSHFNFNQKPGEVKTYNITVKNTTSSSKGFNVKAYDFNMNGKGKSSFLPAGEGKYSLSKWMVVSPTYVEIKPYETKKLNVTVSVPNDDSGRKAAWSIIMIEQEAPREKLVNTKKDGNTVAFGIVPTFAFGVFSYQNPPNVLTNKVEFTGFNFVETKEKKSLQLEVQNQGDGIAYCTSYIDLTNVDTGEQQRLKVKKFTIVPELIRDFSFLLPSKLQKGNYLAVGVLDYENSEEIQAAKIEFKIN